MNKETKAIPKPIKTGWGAISRKMFPPRVLEDFHPPLVARILPSCHGLLISKYPSNNFTRETLLCGKSRFWNLFCKLKTCQFEKGINIFAEKRSAWWESFAEIYAPQLSKCGMYGVYILDAVCYKLLDLFAIYVYTWTLSCIVARIQLSNFKRLLACIYKTK